MFVIGVKRVLHDLPRDAPRPLLSAVVSSAVRSICCIFGLLSCAESVILASDVELMGSAMRVCFADSSPAGVSSASFSFLKTNVESSGMRILCM